MFDPYNYSLLLYMARRGKYPTSTQMNYKRGGDITLILENCFFYCFCFIPAFTTTVSSFQSPICSSRKFSR